MVLCFLFTQGNHFSNVSNLLVKYRTLSIVALLIRRLLHCLSGIGHCQWGLFYSYIRKYISRPFQPRIFSLLIFVRPHAYQVNLQGDNRWLCIRVATNWREPPFPSYPHFISVQESQEFMKFHKIFSYHQWSHVCVRRILRTSSVLTYLTYILCMHGMTYLNLYVHNTTLHLVSNYELCLHTSDVSLCVLLIWLCWLYNASHIGSIIQHFFDYLHVCSFPLYFWRRSIFKEVAILFLIETRLIICFVYFYMCSWYFLIFFDLNVIEFLKYSIVWMCGAPCSSFYILTWCVDMTYPEYFWLCLPNI